MSSPLQPFLRQLGYALFEYLGDRQFALLVDPPALAFATLGPGHCRSAVRVSRGNVVVSGRLPFRGRGLLGRLTTRFT